MKSKKTKLSRQDHWIIDVRKLVTADFPKISSGTLMELFHCGSEHVAILHFEYWRGSTPEQAYAALKETFHEHLGFIELKDYLESKKHHE